MSKNRPKKTQNIANHIDFKWVLRSKKTNPYYYSNSSSSSLNIKSLMRTHSEMRNCDERLRSLLLSGRKGHHYWYAFLLLLNIISSSTKKGWQGDPTEPRRRHHQGNINPTLLNLANTSTMMNTSEQESVEEEGDWAKPGEDVLQYRCCGLLRILEKTAWGRGGPGTRTTLLDLGENLEKTPWGRGRW